MVDKRYRPGSKKKFAQDGQMSEARVAWVRTVTGQLVILKHQYEGMELDEAEIEEAKEAGPTFRLMIPRPGARPWTLNITAMTKQELDYMREFFTLLFDLAEPVVVERDRIADEAYAAGNDAFARSYRQVPQFVVRQGAFGEDGKGVYDGSSGVPFREWRERNLSGGVRGAGDELASDEPEQGGTEDDGPTPDKPSSVR